MHRVHRNQKDQGFTIVELMVATAVFSVLLLVVTVGILQISRVYYRGITESNTQDTARNIIDVISQSIQFSGGDVITTNSESGVVKAFCIGNERFSYVAGRQKIDSPESLSSSQTYNAVVQDTIAGCNGSTQPQDNFKTSTSLSGRELLSPNMRLANLNIVDIAPNLYRVEVRVVYGDDDLLSNPTSEDADCLGATAGSQFCAVTELSTIVRKRVQ